MVQIFTLVNVVQLYIQEVDLEAIKCDKPPKNHTRKDRIIKLGHGLEFKTENAKQGGGCL